MTPSPPIRRFFAALALLATVLAFSACRPAPGKGPVADLVGLPQNASAYLDPATEDTPLLAPDEQQGMAACHLALYTRPLEATANLYPADKVFWGIERFGPKPAFGENTLERDPAWMAGLAEESDTNAYPNRNFPAVCARTTSMRVMPTARPHFNDPALAGEGFPFDNFQNTLIPANTPVHVSHASRDGAWLMAETAWVYGWIRASDLAVATPEATSAFKSPDYLVAVRDGAPVTDQNGTYLFSTRIGMLFPTTDAGEPLAALRDAQGMARMAKAVVPDLALKPFPLAYTPRAVARLANRVLGSAYGWAGLYGNRDCSSTVMDLMAPFGISLPRNSRGQGRSGETVDLAGASAEEKLAALRETGVPWRSLIAMPGHVGLYLGQYRGGPVMLHTVWGLKTVDGLGREGRRIIGRTVVTGLTPGLELPELKKPEGILLYRMTGLALPGPLEPCPDSL